MLIRELVTRLGFDIRDDQLKKFDRQVKDTKTRLNKFSKTARDTGRNMTLFLTTPILAAGGAMIKAASDAEESGSKFNTIFQDIQGKANETAKNFAKNFGQSSVASKTLLGDTADLLTGFNFSQDAALDLSTQVNELAVDLASFTNFSGGAKGASAALTKALLGERESVKSLGVSILEEDVKKKVALNTAKGLTFETERQAKAYATLQIAQEQSKNAIGDFARTQDSFANKMRILGSRINDLAVSFGKILLPMATKIVDKFSSMVEFFDSLSERSKTYILIIGGLVAILGPALFLFGGLVAILTPLIAGFTGLATAIGLTNGALLLLVAKFILIGALIAAAMAVVFLVIDDLIAYFQGEDSLTGIMIEEIGKAVDFVGDKFNSLPSIVKGAIALVLTPIRSAISLVRTLGGALGAIVGGDLGGAWDAIKEGAANAFDPSVVMNNGIGGLMGFGPSTEQKGGGNNVSVNAPMEINVPPGTDPEQVGPYVRDGVKESLSELFTQTGRDVSSPIAE